MFYLKDYKVIKESSYSGFFYKPSTLIEECLGMIGSKEEIGDNVLSHIHKKGRFKEATIEYKENASPIIKRECWADSSIIELVLISLVNSVYHTKGAKTIWYYNTDYPTVNILKVFKRNSLIKRVSLNSCNVELVKLYTKYYLLPVNCKERLLLRYELNILSNNNRNSMGCLENWYDFEYAMTQTFSKEEVEKMSDTEFAHLDRLATNIQEGLY